jgi:hypothetical protein
MSTSQVRQGPVSPRATGRLTLLPVEQGEVRITGGLWADRQRINRERSIPRGMVLLKESGLLESLRVAAGRSAAGPEVVRRTAWAYSRDADIYKLLEAMAWERRHGPDPAQEAFFASTVELLSQAQQADGYLNIYYTVVAPDQRFTNPAVSHEVYYAGLLAQAAIADVRTGGDPSQGLPAVSARFADLLIRDLPTTMPDYVEGHPNTEMAYVELYRSTGQPQVLELARDLLMRRGHGRLAWRSFDPSYYQDDMPVEQATTIRGHAVRALYLLCGAADVYIETGAEPLLRSALAQWDDMVSTKTYITGGQGARHEGEAYGDAFELPNDRAYCETCAAFAAIMLSWRLLLITGESRFADLIERTLYNAFLAGVGADGESFFYVNPLQARAPIGRHAWFDCACCPPNVMRMMSSLEHYLATWTEAGLQVHQYMPGTIRAVLASGQQLSLELVTSYPYDEEICIRVTEAPAGRAELALRIPAWAAGATVTVAGRAAEAAPADDGYLHLDRSWAAGDEVVLRLPLNVRAMAGDPRVDAVRGCVAFERGPLVYCFEGVDLPARSSTQDLTVSKSLAARPGEPMTIGGQTVTPLAVRANIRSGQASTGWLYREAGRSGGPTPPAPDTEIRAVPYYAWANRGPTDMRVWAPVQP